MIKNTCPYNVVIKRSLKLFETHDDTDELPCISTLRIMNSVLDDGIVINNDLICSYYDSIYDNDCYKHSLSKIIEFTDRLFKLKIVDDKILHCVLELRKLDICLQHFTYMTPNHIQIIISSRLQYSFDNKHDKLLINVMFGNITCFNNDIVQKLLTCTNSLVFELLVSNIIIKNEMSTNIITSVINHSNINYHGINSFWAQLCNSLPYSITLISYVLNGGYVLNEYDALMLFDNIKAEYLVSILEKTRIKIVRIYFEIVMVSKNDREIKMNALINNGYVPDINDVLYGIKNGVEIPRIERFDILLGINEYKICCCCSYFPSYKFVGVSDDMKNLVDACFSGKVQKVEIALNKSCKLDSDFMELLSSTNISWPIYKRLVNAGCGITLQCVQNRVPNYSRKQRKVSMDFFDNLFDEIKLKNDEIVKLKNKYVDMKYEIIESVDMKDHTIMKWVKFKYVQDDVDKCKSIGCVGHDNLEILFGVSGVTFIDIKMFIWNKKWFTCDHIYVPDVFRLLFGLEPFCVVKIIDIDYLVCALFDMMGYL